MDKFSGTINSFQTEPLSSSKKNQKSISANDVPFEWDFEKGVLNVYGNEATVFWKDPALSSIFRPLVEEIGVELFRLLVASSSKGGTQDDFDEVKGKDFLSEFDVWSNLAAVAGWGRLDLIEYEPEFCHAVIRIERPWELDLQTEISLNKRWGCPFLQGKIIGLFEKTMGQTCWASEVCDYTEASVTFTVYASEKTIEGELAELRKIHSSEQEQRLQAEIDIKTQQLQNSTSIINHAAEIDFLTKLKNRLALENKLASLIESKAWPNYTLMLINLDQFKVINDTCGHLSGDRLLTMVSAQLNEIVGSDEHLAYRYGGDEFAVLLNTDDTNLAYKLAHDVRHGISKIRFNWEEQRVYQISCSIGLVSMEYIEPAVDAVIIAADDACHQAKENGRNQVYVTQLPDSHVQNRLNQMNWVYRIKDAVANDQFELHFQVLKPLGRDNVIALEALIRMVDSLDGSLIMPLSFLPAAERYGVIFDVDCWVIEHVFQKLHSLEQSDFIESVAINLSGHTLSNPKLGAFINDCFTQYNVEPSQICFELTETHMMMNLETAKDLLCSLRKRGCTISLDDFGAGMSSFGYLRNLPVDKIKIDGSFVKNMDDSLVDCTFIKSIANVARVMKIETVAEFVGNERILELLKEIKVDYAQGYHIAKPQPWDKLFSEA